MRAIYFAYITINIKRVVMKRLKSRIERRKLLVNARIVAGKDCSSVIRKPSFNYAALYTHKYRFQSQISLLYRNVQRRFSRCLSKRKFPQSKFITFAETNICLFFFFCFLSYAIFTRERQNSFILPAASRDAMTPVVPPYFINRRLSLCNRSTEGCFRSKKTISLFVYFFPIAFWTLILILDAYKRARK